MVFLVIMKTVSSLTCPILYTPKEAIFPDEVSEEMVIDPMVGDTSIFHILLFLVSQDWQWTKPNLQISLPHIHPLSMLFRFGCGCNHSKDFPCFSAKPSSSDFKWYNSKLYRCFFSCKFAVVDSDPTSSSTLKLWMVNLPLRFCSSTSLLVCLLKLLI